MAKLSPLCRVCRNPMKLMASSGDDREDRWYCYRDDLTVLNGVEVEWRGSQYVQVQLGLQPESRAIDQADQTKIFDDTSPAPAFHCFYCGKKMPQDAKFCRYCGREQIVP
jgi:hypothetical protein